MVTFAQEKAIPEHWPKKSRRKVFLEALVLSDKDFFDKPRITNQDQAPRSESERGNRSKFFPATFQKR